jgi:anthranilate synthase/aminodeoxychorismate synthase-like glutamine amidotransferase
VPQASSTGPARLLLVDNYDSFTWNLVQYLRELGAAVEVRRNDELRPPDLDLERWDGLVVSPGPGTPSRSGQTPAAIAAFAGKRPVLGVCLGLQAIGELFGGRIVRAPTPVHGKTSTIHHDGRGVFTGLPEPLRATRYHSLVVDRSSLPDSLECSAWTAEGTIMGLRHRSLAIEGVQFHPESIMTPEGKAMLRNFLSAATAVGEP